MPETSISPPAVSRPSKPVSEALLNEKVRFYLPCEAARLAVKPGGTRIG
jgi:hypothetical protein